MIDVDPQTQGVIVRLINPDRHPVRWDHLNVEFTLCVGVSEAHEVRFRWVQSHAEAHIEVDGAEVLRKAMPVATLKTSRRYEVRVGSEEPHAVVIEGHKPALYGGVRKHTFKAYVDGQLVGEY
jgi:hypothetical protein